MISAAMIMSALEVLGEPAQRHVHRHPRVQPVHQPGQRLADRAVGDPGRGRDGLLEPDRAGDRVAQRLRPGGQALQPGHGLALGGGAAQRAPAVGEQRHADPGDHPPGDQQRQDPDDDRDRAADAEHVLDRAFQRAGSLALGLGRQAADGRDEHEQARADEGAGQHREQRERR
jgi:hypothetical protein